MTLRFFARLGFYRIELLVLSDLVKIYRQKVTSFTPRSVNRINRGLGKNNHKFKGFFLDKSSSLFNRNVPGLPVYFAKVKLLFTLAA